MDRRKVLNDQQQSLAIELAETYGIQPEDIIFFGDDTTPFLSYEATCVLANRLADLQDIDLMPVPSVSADSISLKCVLTLANGRTRGTVGVVNVNETIDGVKMSDSQLLALASARAVRGALHIADIDLMKLHRNENNDVLDFKSKTQETRLIAQAHILGREAGLIVGDDKTAWYRLLKNRYQVESSNQLSVPYLADLIAVLKTLVPQTPAMMTQEFTGNESTPIAA